MKKSRTKKISIMLLDPITLNGEGAYNFNSIKQIDVSESFLSMDPDIIKCQTKESLNDCTTRFYLLEVKDKCHCIPYAVSHFYKVHFINFHQSFSIL